MQTMQRIRAFHAVIAVAVIAAFVSEDAKRLHDWLGYLVAVLIVARLVWAALGPAQVALGRYVPSWSEVITLRRIDHPVVGKCLLTGIMTSLLLATLTGLALDPSFWNAMRGALNVISLDIGARPLKTAWLEDLHEGSANATMVLVALHVAYIVAFKRKLGLAMWFLDKRGTRKADRA